MCLQQTGCRDVCTLSETSRHEHASKVTSQSTSIASSCKLNTKCRPGSRRLLSVMSAALNDILKAISVASDQPASGTECEMCRGTDMSVKP